MSLWITGHRGFRVLHVLLASFSKSQINPTVPMAAQEAPRTFISPSHTWQNVNEFPQGLGSLSELEI